MAEMGPTLMLVFVIFAFPIAAFASIGFRYVMLMNAARMAAVAGAKCSSWSVDIDPTGSPPNYSAVTTATKVANQALQKLGAGITLTGSGVKCQIWQCPPAGSPSIVQGPVATQSGYIYNLEVILPAEIAPLVQAQSTFIHIPGVTNPIHTQARADVVFENPNGVTNP